MDEQRSGQSQYSAANIDDCDAGQDNEDMDNEDYEDDEDEDCQEDVDDGSYLNILLQTPIPWQRKMLRQNRQFQVTLL